MSTVRLRATSRPLAALAVATLLMLAGLPAAAQERITSYDVDISILPDGDMEVTERITVVAEGSQIRRGIYRDIPTRYRDRYGNRVRVALEVLGVERDGREEPWFTENLSNGLRINTGDDSFLPGVPRSFEFTIRYRTTRQLGFFDEHDELYWNAIGTGWVFPIERSVVTVRLPEPVAAGRMSVEGYTGPQGAQGTAYEAEVVGEGVARYRLTAPLAPQEGFTIVLTFPKGVVPPPSTADRTRWFFRDNAGVLVALLGFLGLLYYTYTTWSRIGRDPPRGIIIPRYEPPVGRSPASLRYMRRTSYDMRCFTADLLGLAVNGEVRIHQDKVLFRDKWKLERTGGTSTHPPPLGIGIQPAQAELLRKLFSSSRRTLDLHNKNASIVGGARTAHAKVLDSELNPRYFKRNTGQSTIALITAIIVTALSFAVSDGAGVPAIVVIAGLMLVVVATFAWLVQAPTPDGRKLLDEIEGLKLYLSVAERDDIARVQGPAAGAPVGAARPPADGAQTLTADPATAPDTAPPTLDAARYEALLPYAIALDVEDAWTKKFTIAAGAAAVAMATQRMGWYSGSGRPSDLRGFTRSLGSSLNSSISSASTPPGSSSGSGGGGSSGGGGGGGGGGGR